MKRKDVHPLDCLDDAIELVRSERLGRLLLCTCPGLGLTWLVLLMYYLERVEGVHSLRPLFAVGFALAWYARAVLLGRFAGHCVDRQLAVYASEPSHGPIDVLLRVATLMGVELWLWLWLLVLAIRVEPWLALAVLPLLATRGALAPSWLGAADGLCRQGAISATFQVLRSAEKSRVTGLVAELFMLLGALALFLNLGALAAAFISLAQDLLGLSLAFVRAFISPRNHFAVLALAGISLSAFEPLRAALSGVLHARYRLAHEAIEVRALVRACLATAPAKAALSLLLCAQATTLATAQDEPRPRASAPADYAELQPEECDAICTEARRRDDALLLRLVSILEADEFRDFPDPRWRMTPTKVSLGSWLERFLGWLSGAEASSSGTQPRSAPARLRIKPELLAGVALALVLLACALLAPRAWPRRVRASKQVPAPAGAEPRTTAEASSDDLPRDARGTLRSLYLAGLSGLVRRGSLTLARGRTNGQYLRALSAESERALLSELTGLFERARYGHGAPSSAELEHARGLVERLCKGSDPA